MGTIVTFSRPLEPPSEVIIRAFGPLCSHHGLVVVKHKDDPILGSHVVFRRKNGELVVDVENGGFSAWFNLYERDQLIRMVDVPTILRSVGQQDAVSYRARDLSELDREMRNLARLCEAYAGRAINGDPTFYDELLG